MPGGTAWLRSSDGCEFARQYCTFDDVELTTHPCLYVCAIVHGLPPVSSPSIPVARPYRRFEEPARMREYHSGGGNIQSEGEVLTNKRRESEGYYTRFSRHTLNLCSFSGRHYPRLAPS